MERGMQDAFRGCLVGGAAGDALGYTVEFMKLKEIQKKYGPEGIRELESQTGRAVISDDTQMTLFTGAGLLEGRRRGAELNSPQWQAALWELIKEWYDTQVFNRKVKKRYSWLWEVKALHARRAPGLTCLSALSGEEGPGTFEEPVNNSKGCGGVMRVAPVGLFYSPERYTRAEILKAGALCAAQTHGHVLGFLPAAVLALIVNGAVYESEKDLEKIIQEAVDETVDFAGELFPENAQVPKFKGLMEKAMVLSKTEENPEKALKELGEGWTGDEALAVAVYCALRFREDFHKAMTAAVNHDGDSDSTGAVAGNILGAYLGYEKISSSFSMENLEMREVVLKMADELYQGSRES